MEEEPVVDRGVDGPGVDHRPVEDHRLSPAELVQDRRPEELPSPTPDDGRAQVAVDLGLVDEREVIDTVVQADEALVGVRHEGRGSSLSAAPRTWFQRLIALKYEVAWALLLGTRALPGIVRSRQGRVPEEGEDGESHRARSDEPAAVRP